MVTGMRSLEKVCSNVLNVTQKESPMQGYSTLFIVFTVSLKSVSKLSELTTNTN